MKNAPNKIAKHENYAAQTCFIEVSSLYFLQKATSVLGQPLTANGYQGGFGTLESKKPSPKTRLFACFFWSGRRDSNSLPLAPHKDKA